MLQLFVPFNQAIIQYSGWLVDKSRVAALLLLTYHICHAMKRPPRGWRGKWYRYLPSPSSFQYSMADRQPGCAAGLETSVSGHQL